MAESLSEIKSLIASRKEYFHSRFGVSSMGLFGSCTRKDFDTTSDIDLLVTFDRPIGLDFIELATELEQLLNRKVDLVTENSINSHIRPFIKKDLVYV